VITGVVAGLRLDTASMERAAARDEMMAAGLAVALAREGMPFRKAHALVGSLVAESQAEGSTLRAVATRRLPEVSPAVAARVDSLFDPRQAVRTKAARGGTAPDAVRASLRAAREAIGR
jgi:argininosuccinate lyase